MNILITGASGGLGLACAKALAAAGDTVYALDLHPVAETEGLRFFSADITREDALLAVRDALGDTKLDAIVHFAGMIFIDNFLEVSEQRLTQIFDVNVLGAMRVNRVFFPLLAENGRILITTSEVAPLDPLPFNGIYSTTKTALDCYAQALRQEVGLLGRRVITLRPGAFQTPLSAGSIPSMHAMAEKSAYFGGQGERFEALMRRFTGKLLQPEVLAKRVCRILHAAHPRNINTVHANFGLRLLALLPKSAQTRLVRALLGRNRRSHKQS